MCVLGNSIKCKNSMLEKAKWMPLEAQITTADGQEVGTSPLIIDEGFILFWLAENKKGEKTAAIIAFHSQESHPRDSAVRNDLVHA